MNKRFVSVVVLLMMCLLALTGCSAIKGLEKDLQVVLEVNGEYYDCVTVNSFNNAVVKEPQAPEGLIFRGWTVQESWTEEEAAAVPVIDNTGLVRYNDVKDAAAKNALSVTLRAVFTTPPKRDLVIAWYAKESTSGLNAGHMEGFQEKLYAYLTSQGYKPEAMDIVIRPYEGGVADTCAAINKDADVDITVGWSSTNNLTTTGGWTEGVDFVENVSGVTIGAKSRYTARISGTDLSLLVYAWIQNEYGQGVGAASAPAQQPAATEQPAAETPAVVVDDGKLVIGWYAKSATSGLDEAIIVRFEEVLRAQLTAAGYPQELVIRPYDGVVADVQAAVLAAGDVDLMVGMKAFALEGIEMEAHEDVAMGEKTGRRLHRISNEEIAINVFEWLKAEAANGLFLPEYTAPATTLAPAAQAAPAVAGDGKLVVGWYAKSETSGLDEALVATFTEALKVHLAAAGYTEEVVVRPYNGVVDEVQAAVLADGDVDLMIGMKKFALEGVEMEVQNDVAMGEKTDRRIHRISGEAAAVSAFEWAKAEAANGLFLPGYVIPVQEAPAAAGDGKLVVGWYAKSETSGLDEALVATFTEALKVHLAAAGYTEEVVVRPYNGVVDEVQAAVTADGDVDLMIGMKKFALEGVEMEVQNDVAMGEKTDRRIHRISDEAAAVSAFEWAKAEAANGLFLPGYVIPVQEAPAAAGDGKLVIGWYAKSETSGLDDVIVARFEEGLKAHLATAGYAGEVVIRPYNGVVDEVQNAVTADGDVDLMIGMKKFALEGIEMEVQNDVVMGAKADRRIHRISGEEIAASVFEWLKTEDARSLFAAQ